MGPAERADLIVDFTQRAGRQPRPRATSGPTSRSAAASRRSDFDVADPATTGQVMQFRVVPRGRADHDDAAAVPAAAGRSRRCRRRRSPGRWPCIEEQSSGLDDAPAEALLGTVVGTIATGACAGPADVERRDHREPGGRRRRRSGSSTTPRPTPTRCTSTRSFFEVVDRQASSSTKRTRIVRVAPGSSASPRPSRGRRASRTRSSPIPARSRGCRRSSAAPGQFVWHCHIVEHEDNEMMRPYRIGPPQPGQPA